MELSLSEIHQLITAISELDCREVEVVVGDVRIAVRRDGLSEGGTAPLGTVSSSPARTEAVPDRETASTTDTGSAGDGSMSTKPSPSDDTLAQWLEQESQGKVTVIRSPMLGTAYRAKEPGAPPFVEIGQQVEPEDVVALVEVMKLFHSVEAGQAGTVAAILFEDGELVEYDAPLVVLQHETAIEPI